MEKMMMKKFFLATAIGFVATAAAANIEVDTGGGRPNVVIVDGVSYKIPLARICGVKLMPLGQIHAEIGRSGAYVTIAGITTRILCQPSSGGSSTTVTQNGTHTGQTATDIARDVYHNDPSLVGPIDHVAVAGTGSDDNGHQQAGDIVHGQGQTQSDMTSGATDHPSMDAPTENPPMN